jgi:hypothetical protein
VEWITFPSNTSGPLPRGNVGMFGTPLDLPVQRITKFALYICIKKHNVYEKSHLTVLLKAIHA